MPLLLHEYGVLWIARVREAYGVCACTRARVHGRARQLFEYNAGVWGDGLRGLKFNVIHFMTLQHLSCQQYVAHFWISVKFLGITRLPFHNQEIASLPFYGQWS